jgi:MYXO-CTERM domain-containing protein
MRGQVPRAVRRSARLVVAAVALACGACVSPDADVEAVPGAVVNGTAATTCVFPSCLMGRGCTSTLVHPRLVTTAAHCVQDMQMDGIANVGEAAPFVRTVQRQLCRRPPQYTNANAAGAYDIAFCILREEINDVPIVPVLSACEAAQMIKPGQQVIIAGFGAPNNGRKYWGEVAVTSLRNGAEVLMRGNGVSAGSGDSGGPGYLKMPDGTWRTFGVASRAGGGTSIYTLISAHIAWIEKESGFDITPCYGPDGRWEDGPGCDRFPTDPGGTRNGTWADMCRASPVAKPTRSCPADYMPGDGGPVAPPPRDASAAEAPRPDARADAAPVIPDAAPDLAPPKTPDAPPAAGGAGGGAGGTGGAGETGGAGGGPGPSQPPSKPTGCSCSMERTAPTGAPLALVVLLLLFGRRTVAARARAPRR